MPTASLEGLDVYYELHGKGRPLVLIAGYTFDHSLWDFMLAGLAQQFEVLIFDNRAVGQTKDDNRSFNLETMADDTITLIQQLNLHKPHIFGQSMGGAIAQLIAKKYPQQIDKLIILNSSFKFNQRTKFLCQALLDARAKNIDLESLIELSMSCFFGSQFLANEPLCVEFKKSLLTYPFPQSIFDQQRQLNALDTFDSSCWLNELNVPTLVISALEDIITTPEESKNLANKINQAQFASVEGGHSSPLEAFEQVNKHVINFL